MQDSLGRSREQALADVDVNKTRAPLPQRPMEFPCGNDGNRISAQFPMTGRPRTSPPIRMHVGRLQPYRHLSALVRVIAPRATRLIGGVYPVPCAFKPEVLRRERVFGSNENNARIFPFFCRFRIVCFNLLQFPARAFILKNP